MSNDKPCAVATITFYPNKHVEVELSTIRNITPRTLDIASHIMLKTYQGMKAQFLAEEHRQARKDKADAEAKAIADDKAFHEAEDIRLAEAAAADDSTRKAIKVAKDEAEAEVAVEKVPEEDEAPEETETESEAANDPADPEDTPEVA